MMNPEKHTIFLRSQKRRVAVDSGQNFLVALIESGLLLRADCGGKGRCGKCRIRILESAADAVSPPTRAEIDALGQTEIQAGFRLACHSQASGDLAIDIPESSLLSAEVAQKGPPMLADVLPAVRIPSQPAGSCGIAVDLGTTTIAVYLCDFDAGTVAGSTSMRNPQIVYGDDVMSRITAVHRDPGVLKKLQKMAVKAIEWGVEHLCRSTGVPPRRLRRMLVVGNSTMIHLFVGEDPSSLGLYPYRPRFTEERNLRAGSLGFRFNPSSEIVTLPLISGFLGSDIIAAALAADLASAEAGVVLVDVGTNGEVMLRNGHGFWATSCATGPAFEGAAIRHGMHAISGAIDAATIDPGTGAASCSVIQRDPKRPKDPSGICGSGVVSIVAELYRAGIILPDGRFEPTKFPDFFQTSDEGMAEYILIDGRKTHSGRPITVTQKDIRAIQLAKGALSAGIELLCRESGCEHPHKILIAGAFGSYIRTADALTIGMFPPGLAPSNLITIGNAAGAGAILALFDENQRENALEMAAATEVLDLARHSDFQNTFIDMLAFP